MPFDEHPTFQRLLQELPSRLTRAHRQATRLAVLSGLSLATLVLVGGSVTSYITSGTPPTRETLIVVASIAVASGLTVHSAVRAALRVWVRAHMVDLVIEAIGGLVQVMPGPEQVFGLLMHTGEGNERDARPRRVRHAMPALPTLATLLAALTAAGALLGSRYAESVRDHGEKS